MATKVKKSVPKLKALDKSISSKLQVLDSKIARLSMQAGSDLSKLEERSMVAWEYLQSIIELLKSNSMLGITDEAIQSKRTSLVKKWHDEHLEKVKGKLKYPQYICTACYHVATDKDATAVQCPGCSGKDLYRAPKEVTP